MKSVLLSEEGEYVKFQNFKRSTRAPFIIYDYFECVLIPSFDNIDFGPNTKKYQDHIACSYGYRLISADDRYGKPYKTCFGEDAIDKFLNYMIKESEYSSEVTETEFNKPLAMPEKDHENFNYSIKFWICKKAYE